MCGIAGYCGAGNRGILESMTNTLAHRGPDGAGFFCVDGIGLGHRRLSIIDLEGGKQPMANEDETVWIVFNGEIYNFRELRDSLSARGHKFKTSSDTETIVHLYEEKELDFLSDLDGMFALALWDKKSSRLVLARDRLGKKPLYYAVLDHGLIFGSELKALLKYPALKREIDPQCLAEYLVYGYVPAPHSIFKNVFKLKPAEFLVFENGQKRTGKYWDMEFGESDLSEAEILKELDVRINWAVKERLISDVPLGVFLSGGLDSSAIAYYAQKNSREKIKTFSVGFPDKSFDESAYARRAAKFLGTEHYEMVLGPDQCLDAIPRASDFLDEPFADASVIPTYLLSVFTRQKVTVALGGDGGDELFLGYPTFLAYALDRRLPGWIKNRVMAPITRRLPVRVKGVSWDFKLKRFVSGAKYRPEVRNQIWLGAFEPEQAASLLNRNNSSGQPNPNKILENYLVDITDEPEENRVSYLYFKNYLQDGILSKVDRASMAASLEVRAPFLDYQLVDFVNSLSWKMKMKRWRTKYLLKELMKDKLPREIVFRPKQGFGNMMLGKWLRHDLKDYLLDIFAERKIKEQGIFNYPYLKKILDAHLAGRADHRVGLWALLMFELWYEKWYLN